MAPLEDLEQDYPIIDSNFRMFCASHGIFTDEDFLVHDLYALEGFAGQGYAPEKLKQGIKQVFSIMENQHQPWLNGLELLEDARLNKCTLSTGCERVDVLLQGGLRKGHLTELVGPSSSCKTQVCLKSAAHVARNYLGKVIYFDTGNSFSPKRVVQFLGLSSDPSTAEANKTVERVMSSIELAHEYNLSVVVTNHMVGGEAGTSKPALGESWKSIPHARLLLSRNYSTNDSCITILKHPCLATGKSTDFVVM